MYKFYSALVIEPIPEKRLRLRMVAAEAPCFNRVDPCPSFSEALARLETETRDVVFIGELALEDSKAFIEKAKKMPNGRLCAFIFLRQERQQTEGNTALDVMYGADSILYAPFSIDNVVATTKIADRIKEIDADARSKAAMEMLIGSVMSEVDQIGEASSSQEEDVKPPALGKLRQLGEQLKQATKATSADYFGIVSKAFIEATPPIDKKNKQGYGGVSARVQRIIDRKAKKDAENGS